ncbi:hypothetical protein BC826DRAFT_1044376 [Russula brevipes]|nr:hypothetical protein BC826DRAFT_1044376 [Russula brevipes]
MQVPFPELTYLHLDASVPTLILHDSFLGGSAPRLRSLCLVSIAFSAIRKLLLSTRDLVNLHLVDVPDSRFISPEELVTCLCELPRLELFGFGFESPQSLPTQRSSPPPTHNVLPSLTGLALHGTGEYVEDFIARIDTPLLKDLIISFIDPILDIPQLYAFICRTDTFELHHEVTLLFFESSSGHWQMSGPTFLTRCTGLGLQVSSMACTCSWLSPLFHNVERLDLINQRPSGSSAEDDIEHTQFLALLRSFSAIKRLRVYKTRTRWWVFSESTFQQ